MAAAGNFSFRASFDVSELLRGIDNVVARFRQASRDIENLQITPAVNLQEFTSGATNAANTLRRQFADAAFALQGFSQQLQGIADGIFAFGNSAREAFIEFDAAKAKVGTLTSESEAYAETMRGLSRELGFQASSTELLAAGYEVLSAGFSETSDNVEILRASVLGAQGGFSDVKTVADATTTVINAFGKSAGDAASIVDTLAQTQNLGKITIDQYAQQIGRVASIAAAAGVSFEELSASVATATAKGVQGEAAISGLRQAISNLVKPTAEAQQLLESYGISSAAATLQQEGLQGVLRRLSEAGATSNETLSKIFSSTEALAVITPLVSNNLADFNSKLEGIGNSAGIASAAADTVANSFEGRAARAANQANEAFVSLGKGFQAVVSPLLEAIASLVGAFNRLPDGIKEGVGAVLALVAGLATLAAGALAVSGTIFAFGAALPGITAGLTAVSGAVSILTGALGGLTAAATAAVAAIGAIAVAGAAVTKLTVEANTLRVLNEEFDGFRQQVEAAGNESLRLAASTQKLSKALQDGGEITEQELSRSRQQIALNKEKIAANQELLAKISELEKANGGLTEQGIALQNDLKNQNALLQRQTAELEKAIAAASSKSSANQQLAQSEEDVAAALERVSATRKAAEAEAVASKELAVAQLQEKLAQGIISEQQFAEQSLQIARDAAAQKLAIAEQELKSLQELKGSLPADQFRQLELQAEQQVSAAKIELAKQVVAAKIEQEKAAIEQFKVANAEAVAAVELANQQILASIRQRVADGILSEQEAQSEVARLAAETSAQKLAIAEKELADLASLRDKVSPEKLAEMELAAQKKVADARLAQIDAVIAAQQRERELAIQGYDEELKRVEAVKAARLGGFDAVAKSLQSEQVLLDARNNLEKAIGNAQISQLQNALKIAEATGNQNEILKLRGQIQNAELQQLQKQQEFQTKSLEISQRIRENELQRQLTLAEIAVKEQEIALIKARASNASQAEIELQEQILSLQQEKLQQAQEEIDSQAEINNLQRQALQIQQQTESQAKLSAIAAAEIKDSVSQASEAAGSLLQKFGGLPSSISKSADEAERLARATNSAARAAAELANQQLGSAAGTPTALSAAQRAAAATGDPNSITGLAAFFESLESSQKAEGGLSSSKSFLVNGKLVEQGKLAFAFGAAKNGNLQPLKDLGIDPNKLPKFATGTRGRPITQGMAMVGERGPELINVTPRGVDVLPLGRLPGFAAGTNSFNLQALQQQLQRLYNEQKDLRLASYGRAGDFRENDAELSAIQKQIDNLVAEIREIASIQTAAKTSLSEASVSLEAIAQQIKPETTSVSNETVTINIIDRPQPERDLREALREVMRSRREESRCQEL